MATFGATVLGRRLELTLKAAPPLQDVGGRSNGWWPITVREPFTGAWQVNMEARRDVALTYFAVFACVTLIASDIGKLALQLMALTGDGTWEETSNPAFSPVLRKPNRYQTTHKFVEQWITSKLVWGNTYVLKQRDQRGVVVGLYVLDPSRVRPLVAPDGGVYYECSRDNLGGDLAGLGVTSITVPAREIIHDTMVCLFHPLVGISPIYACGLAAMQGLAIQNNSSQFFANGSNPGGVLTAPGAINDETAKRLKDYWDQNFTGANVGKVAVLGDGLKYEAMIVNAVDAQLIEQLKWTAETVCSCFHVPSFMIGLGAAPHFATGVEPLLQLYYSQCLQSLLTNFEQLLDEGLGLADPINGTQYGTQFDIDDLVWMDTATKTKAAADAIGAGAMSPDEARWKYFGLPPVTGGDTPYMQQQMFSLKALAKRDQNDPFSKPEPAPMAAAPAADQVPADQVAAHVRQLLDEGARRMTADELAALVEGIAPVVRDVVQAALAEVTTRVQVVDTQLAGLVTATTEVGVMRERLVALETRPPLPGPPGPDGAPGPPGKDGAPGLEYCGVFADGQVYNLGQIVTAGGSAWHCNEATTTRPGDGAKAWTLMVKRGRDYGKDGKA